MSQKLFLSVAMATCNGERYITEQLDSVARQSRVPDELVVFDDRSDDRTPALVEEFSRRVAFPVRLQINPDRLGSTRNFDTAIRACSGDIIFLCDQDDVWYPQKVARIEICIIENPSAGAVFSNADVVDADLRPLGLLLWKRFRFSEKEQMQVAASDALSVLLKHSVVTGATMAFRSDFRDLVLSVSASWIHDAWIVLLVRTVSDMVPLPGPLIAYRRHGANQICLQRGITKREKSCAEIYGSQVAGFEIMIGRTKKISGSVRNIERKPHDLEDKTGFLRARAALPAARWKRIPVTLRVPGASRYHRYAAGFGSFRKDVMR